MKVIDDYNKNGAWNMLAQKKGESDLIKDIIWNFQVRWMVETLEGPSSVNIPKHKDPVYQQDQIEQMITNAITQAGESAWSFQENTDLHSHKVCLLK